MQLSNYITTSLLLCSLFLAKAGEITNLKKHSRLDDLLQISVNKYVKISIRPLILPLPKEIWTNIFNHSLESFMTEYIVDYEHLIKNHINFSIVNKQSYTIVKDISFIKTLLMTASKKQFFFTFEQYLDQIISVCKITKARWLTCVLNNFRILNNNAFINESFNQSYFTNAYFILAYTYYQNNGRKDHYYKALLNNNYSAIRWLKDQQLSPEDILLKCARRNYFSFDEIHYKELLNIVRPLLTPIMIGNLLIEAISNLNSKIVSILLDIVDVENKKYITKQMLNTSTSNPLYYALDPFCTLLLKNNDLQENFLEIITSLIKNGANPDTRFVEPEDNAIDKNYYNAFEFLDLKMEQHPNAQQKLQPLKHHVINLLRKY